MIGNAERCARLFAYPQIKEFKIGACKSFIIDALLYNQKLSEKDILSYLEKNHAILSIPRIIFNKAITDLIQENVLINENGIYSINVKIKSESDSLSKNNQKIYNGMIDSFICGLKNPATKVAGVMNCSLLGCSGQ